MKSQSEQILKELKNGRELTAVDALNEFGCFRLAARCYDLREMGHDIISRVIKKNGKRFSGYKLA